MKFKIDALHFITQDHPEKSHQDLALAACMGGVKWVQVRVKNRDAREIENIAGEIKEIGRKYGARIILNDHVDIAIKLGLDGVHLGKEDMDPAKARSMTGKEFIIGATANTLEDVESLNSTPIDYIGLGPFRYTSTKDKLSPVLGVNGIHNILLNLKKNSVPIPVIAIGGITLSDINELMQTGIHGIAIAGSIGMSKDPEKTAKSFLEELNRSLVFSTNLSQINL